MYAETRSPQSRLYLWRRSGHFLLLAAFFRAQAKSCCLQSFSPSDGGLETTAIPLFNPRAFSVYTVFFLFQRFSRLEIAMDRKQFFDQNGYATAEGVFTAAEMDELVNRVDALESRDTPYPEGDLKWEPSNDSVLRNAFGLLHRDPAFYGVATHSKLISIVEELLGPDLGIYADGLFAKPAFDGSVVPPHQDMHYWSFEPYKMLTAWIALEDATRENGCMTVIPESHKLGLLEHEETNVPGNTWMLTERALSRLGSEVQVELSKGSVGFHHCLTYHRSEPNRSPRSRRAYTVIFMTGEARWMGKEDYRYPFLHVQGRPAAAYEAMKHVQVEK